MVARYSVGHFTTGKPNFCIPDMQDEIKHLSRSFKTDAEFFIEKARVAFANSILKNRTSFQSKLVIDAYMSAECALKSLICSTHPDQRAEDAYTLILKCGHNLAKLLKHAGNVPLSDEDKSFLRVATKRGVRLRYSLDLFNLTTSEIIPNDQVSFKIDAAYVKRFFGIAEQLFEHSHQTYLGAISSEPKIMTLAEIEALVGRLRKIKPAKKSVLCNWRGFWRKN